MNGVQYGAFSQTVGMNAWPLDSGAPTNLSMSAGPKGSPVAFMFGFTAGSTSVNGFPGLVVDIAQAKSRQEVKRIPLAPLHKHCKCRRGQQD